MVEHIIYIDTNISHTIPTAFSGKNQNKWRLATESSQKWFHFMSCALFVSFFLALSLCLSLPAIRMIAPHWIGDVEITNNNLLPLYEIITAFYHDMNSK